MSIFSDILGGIGDIFGSAFDFVGDAAEFVYDMGKEVVGGLNYLGDITLDIAPYAAAVAGYYYGGPLGAQAAYNLTGGEGWGESFEKDPLSYASGIASTFMPGESDSLMNALLGAGLGILQTDEGSYGTEVGGVDIFSADAEAAMLKIAKDAVYDKAMEQAWADWEAAGGANVDEALPVPSVNLNAIANEYNIDWNSLSSILSSDIMAGSNLTTAYEELEAIKAAAIAAAATGSADPPVTPPPGDTTVPDTTISDELQAQLDNLITETDLTAGLEGITNAILGTLGSSLGGLESDITDLASELFGQMGDIIINIGGIDVQLGDINTGLASLEDLVGSGFDNIDQVVGDMQANMEEGFGIVNQELADVQANIESGFQGMLDTQEGIQQELGGLTDFVTTEIDYITDFLSGLPGMMEDIANEAIENQEINVVNKINIQLPADAPSLPPIRELDGGNVGLLDTSALTTGGKSIAQKLIPRKQVESAWMRSGLGISG